MLILLPQEQLDLRQVKVRYHIEKVCSMRFNFGILLTLRMELISWFWSILLTLVLCLDWGEGTDPAKTGGERGQPHLCWSWHRSSWTGGHCGRTGGKGDIRRDTSLYCALIGWISSCQTDTAQGTKIPKLALRCVFMVDEWLPCSERIFYRRWRQLCM